MQESDFFLPDYSETDVTTKEILFAVDTSGSTEEKTLNAVYAEPADMMEQPGNRIQGILVFFDIQVYKPNFRKSMI